MLDSSLLTIAVFMGTLFISVSLHEMMHAYTALKLGDDLAHSRGRISLNPLHHIDPVLTIALPAAIIIGNELLGMSLPLILAAKPVPINTNRISGGELGLAAVGIAGPLTNLALASVAALGLNVFGMTGLSGEIVLLFIQLNIALFAFNMLPIPPLDGSRVLYAVAPAPMQRVMEQIERYGITVIFLVLIFLGPIISPVLITVNETLLGLLVR